MTPKVTITNCQECKSYNSSVFCNLDDELLNDLNKNKSVFLFKKGQYIFTEGGRPTGVYCIIKGRVKIHKFGLDKDQIVRIGSKSDIIGYRALISKELYSATAEALEDTEVCFIPKASFLDFINKDKDLPLKMMRILSKDVKYAERNSMNIAQASILIKRRGELMHSSIEPNISGMAAIIGKNASSVDEIIKKNNLDVVIANDNSPKQVVVSGLIEAINNSENVFSQNGVKKYIKLNVSAAFHSKFMNDAQNKLNDEIDKISFKNKIIPIISNYDANINSEVDKVIFALKNQMSNKVNWTKSIKTLEGTDIDQIIEIGPGKVLSGLISRITNKFDIKSIDKIMDLEKFN